ncbi:TetR/AcrR family transcriptional regulator [Cryobacterium sp. PAMC25264]|uniref:TetR/AcrR family transcriptional regulator n=1 Tax=Cryobacterium sp. PAMC25264 TaxID=2861288 RepID=UPI001C631051|nr:TetR/AcrR family transcriptional regulator [Cryobacterium sp. PAMC25264]QYF72727.1 TetR/AcrR family transcriptional regulator [Cryobacterium sp. PAMC25264]
MAPRPVPDLNLRRDQITQAACSIAESEGWTAVTMRRVATEIGVTQPVLYSAFAGGRQALLEAVALQGFTAIADALDAVAPDPMSRMRAYLGFATSQPRLYEVMFSMPSGLPFGADDSPAPLRRAFAAIQEAFPGTDDTASEVAWATLHGLATLQISGRIPAGQAEARLNRAHAVLAH